MEAKLQIKIEFHGIAVLRIQYWLHGKFGCFGTIAPSKMSLGGVWMRLNWRRQFVPRDPNNLGIGKYKHVTGRIFKGKFCSILYAIASDILIFGLFYGNIPLIL